MAAEDDALDQELEQLLALGGVRDGEQRVEVLEDMAELGRVEGLSGHAVDLGLHPRQVMFEQPEVALLQRELGADGLEAGTSLGDGSHQPIHLRARLGDAREDRALLAPEWLGALIVRCVRGGDGAVEQVGLGDELAELVLGPLLDLVGVDLLDRALVPSALERRGAAVAPDLPAVLLRDVVQRHPGVAGTAFEQSSKREGSFDLGDKPGACGFGSLHAVPQLGADDAFVDGPDVR